MDKLEASFELKSLHKMSGTYYLYSIGGRTLKKEH